VPRPLRIPLLELADERGRRRLGEAAGQQEVAGVPTCDVDELAAQAELLDVLIEDHVHRGYLSETYGSRAISRARFTATATCRW
jgi:hypothetical protein